MANNFSIIGCEGGDVDKTPYKESSFYLYNLNSLSLGESSVQCPSINMIISLYESNILER
jgi:hypothetical protein